MAQPSADTGQKPMRKSLVFSLTFTSLFVLCAGCDTAARQQQAEEARRQKIVNDLKALGKSMHNKQAEEARRKKIVNDLKALGKSMHNKQGSESTTDSAAADAPPNTSDSPPNNVDSSK